MSRVNLWNKGGFKGKVKFQDMKFYSKWEGYITKKGNIDKGLY